MINERLLAVAKERYELEFNRRSHLVSISGIYLAGISLLIFLIWDIYVNFPLGLSVIHLIFYALVILLLNFIVRALINLLRFFWGQTYGYVPMPNKIVKFVNELRTYFDQNYEEFFKDKGSKEDLIDNRLSEKLLKSYIRYTEQNHNTNNSRIKRVYKIGYYLLCAIIIFAISLIPYAILTSHST